MFEDNRNNEFDILMKSVLAQAEEEVPSRVWEGISSELDRIEAAKVRRPVMVWFRRSAIAVAAAAAVAVGVFVDWSGHDGDIVPQGSGTHMIAVAEPEPVSDDAEATLIADAQEEVRKAVSKVKETVPVSESSQETVIQEQVVSEEPETVSRPETVEENASEPAEEKPVIKEEAATAWTDDWAEDDDQPKARREIAVTASGTAGTNNVQKNGGGLMRRPSLSVAKPKTGVEQKSTESTYGLPVSFGAGVQFSLSDRWSLGIGANYTLLTRKFFGTYTSVNSEGVIETSVSSDIRNVQQYIGIPVNAFYNILKKDYVNFYAYAGGTVEKCISDKYDILNTEYLYKGTAKGVQLSANVGLGVEFLVGRHLGIYVDPSLRYYFNCGQPASIRTSQPLMMGLEMGLRFRL